MRRSKYLICFFILFFVLPDLSAQKMPGQIITDRPDITESASTVPRGYLQIENGFLFEKHRIDDVLLSGEIHNYTFSAMLIRYGLLKNVELRLGENYLFQKTRIGNSENSLTGISDFLAGTKIQLLEEDLNYIDLGVIVQFHLPIGNEVLRPESTESELLIAFAKSLNDDFSFSGNIGTYRSSNPGRFIYLYSGSVGIKLNDDWGAFTEIYGSVPSGGKINFMYDLGFSYLPVANLQLDFSVGMDSITNAGDWFAGAGISLRLPH